MELLAPAGNMECLKAAVDNGADAVYFAGKSFGARSFADNFSKDEIYEAVRYCKPRAAKTYVTVNTMTFDREFKELDKFIALLADAGVDGVIVQDLGVAERIKQICPELPIHASTQMTVHNLEGVLALEKMGIRRVVLSRELSENEIRYIAENCNAELEVFVHGAMCMSYSGQCLMSSVLGGRSGNRGKCAQPCRLTYGTGNGNDKYYLSLKDMSLIEHLKSLSDMGIASLKIEGRMKGTDYVSEVVDIYRSCIDADYISGRDDIDRLNRVFYRGGLTDGYYAGKTGIKMFAFDKPDNPYEKTKPVAMQKSKGKTRVLCRAVFAEGRLAEIYLEGMGVTVEYFSESELETAQKNPLTNENALNQLTKTGGTAYEFSPVEAVIEGSPYVPVKLINEMRRNALELFENKLIENTKRTVKIANKIKRNTYDGVYNLKLTASVEDIEQYRAVAKFPLARIDVPLKVIYENQEELLRDRERIVIKPEAIIKDGEYAQRDKILSELKDMGFLYLRVNNICHFNHSEFKLLAGYRMNIANSVATEILMEQGFCGMCLSSELNLAQIRDLYKPIEAEAIIYGHIPLMITENCILKNMGKCSCSGKGEIYDRRGKIFPVIKDGDSCRSVVLNGVPTYMGDKLRDIEKSGISYGQLMFTIEDSGRCEEICNSYFNNTDFNEEYTRLHFYKGVL